MSERTPVLIIISGPPGAGKTTLARPLARYLGMPLFEKDAIKERMADAIGPYALEISGKLGRAAILELYAAAEELLRTGQDVMVESFFHHGLAEGDLAPLSAMARSFLIHIYADEAVLFERYRQRAGESGRHPVHEVGNRIGDLHHYLAEGVCDPLDLDIPKIYIDTTYGEIDAEEVAYMVREWMAKQN